MRNIDPEQYSYLLDTYLRHFNLDLPEGTVDTYEQIISFQAILKNILPSKEVLNKLLNVVITKIENNKRFQKLALVTLIRHHSNVDDIDKKTTDKLFFLFKELISTASEAIEWKLTSLIKDKELSEENICWLIDNYEKSTHIVNRLLRYPIPNRRISNWADYCLKNNILGDRLSELIGLKLNFNKKFKHKDKIAFVWGVHYSKLDLKTKKDLLLSNTNKKNFIEVLKICERNSLLDVISFFFHEFNKVR